MLNKELVVKVSPEYPIFIDSDAIENLEEKIFKFTNANKILIVISEKVNKLYGEKLNFKNSIKFVLKDGEKQKNFKNYKKISFKSIIKKHYIKDVDLLCMYKGLKSERLIDFKKYPCLKSCFDEFIVF